MSLYTRLFPNSITAVEERWTEYNKIMMQDGCPCGKVAVGAVYDHRNVGSVPVAFPRCEKHLDKSENEILSTYIEVDSSEIPNMSFDKVIKIMHSGRLPLVSWQGKLGRISGASSNGNKTTYQLHVAID
jgi:hypothetical protein